MKKNDIKKLNKKTEADLQKILGESKEELRSLKFDLASGEVKNIQKVRDTRKKIARVLTFLGEKERAKVEKENG